jgi:hypothetical protein
MMGCKSGIFLKKLDIPQRSMYMRFSALKDSKHYYTSKAFSLSINERAVHTSVSRLFHFSKMHLMPNGGVAPLKRDFTSNFTSISV